MPVPENDPRAIIELDPTAAEAAKGDEPVEISPEKRYIAVAGNIGAGKSSLVDFLCQKYDIKPFFEPNEENPYLEDFYKDMSRWAFQSQVYFLTAKFRLHQELDMTPYSVVQDRTLWEDAEIFAENLYQSGTMQERDYRTYRHLYESIQGKIRPPDLMIYLRCPVRAVRKRIRQRGRQMEKDIPVAYLKRLHKLYENWIDNYDLSPLMIIPTGELDYATDLVDQYDILKTVEKYL